MCSIDIEPCNQARRHLRGALRQAEMAILDEIEDDEDEPQDDDFMGGRRPRWTDDD